jgi:hypothetical protein
MQLIIYHRLTCFKHIIGMANAPTNTVCLKPLFRKESAMRSIILSFAVLGVLSILAAPVMAGDAVHSNIVQYYHGGYHGNYHANYHPVSHGAYYGGWNGYRGYYPQTFVSPVVVSPLVTSPMFPPRAVIYPEPVYQPYYGYYPSAGFYYSSPQFSIGVGY